MFDDFTCLMILSADELMFLHGMCTQASRIPRKIRRKIGDSFDMIIELEKRLSLQLKSYEAYIKEKEFNGGEDNVCT